MSNFSVFTNPHDGPQPMVQDAVAAVLVGEQLPLDPEQDAIDGQGHQGDDHQHQEDVFPLLASLRDVDDVAQAARLGAELDLLGQHDVAEGQAEQEPQRVEDGWAWTAARGP